MQVGQQFDDFVLRGRIVAEFVLGELPQFFDAALAVHQAHQVMSNISNFVRAAAGSICDHVDRLSTVAVFADIHAGTQIGAKVRDPVPHGTVDLLGHSG